MRSLEEIKAMNDPARFGGFATPCRFKFRVPDMYDLLLGLPVCPQCGAFVELLQHYRLGEPQMRFECGLALIHRVDDDEEVERKGSWIVREGCSRASDKAVNGKGAS